MSSNNSLEELVEQFRMSAAAVQAGYRQLEYELLSEGVEPWETMPAPGSVELPNLAPLYMVGTLVSGLTQSSIVIDQNLRIVNINDAAQAILSVDDNMNLGEAITGTAKDQLRALIDSGESKGGVELALKDGTTIGIYDCIYLDNPIEKGQLLLLVAQDLEMRQMREVEDQILKNLTGTLVHEIRTPLTSMQGFAELLLQVQNLEPGESNKLQMIRGGIDRLNLLASALSTVFQDIVEPRWVKVEMNSFFKHSLNRIIELSDLDSTSLGLLELDKEIQIVSDPELLYLAFEEIVGNALDEHEIDGVPVVVEMLLVNDSLQISVTNQASIPKGNEPDNWWVPFFTNKSGHLGLGLVKVRRILEALGGSVTPHEINGSEVKLEIQIPI